MRASIIVRTSYPPMWGVYDYELDARCWGFPHRQDAIDFARVLAATRRAAVVEIYSRHGRLESREEYAAGETPSDQERSGTRARLSGAMVGQPCADRRRYPAEEYADVKVEALAARHHRRAVGRIHRRAVHGR